MKILAIETSCDETAISIVKLHSKKKNTILSDSVLSQIEIHKQYGGVFPAVAKREHINNIFPLLLSSLKVAKVLERKKSLKKIDKKILKKLNKILDRDEYNLENIIHLFENYKKPKIDALAVTYGPGLEIALWTGFNIARALSEIWNIKLIPTNHMEGHIFSSLIKKEGADDFKILEPTFPALSLLISGGHTDLVLAKSESNYKIIGSTLDDAVGEAYDKSARLLGISYPGGPEISKLAESFYKGEGGVRATTKLSLPRPLLNKNNFDFSFSGLKTAVLYLVKNEEKKGKLKIKFKRELSAEFENAVSEVLIKKTKKAVKKYGVKSLIIAGGVSANNRLRKDFKNFEKEMRVAVGDVPQKKNFKVFLPNKKYTGDNALMIAVAGYFNLKKNKYPKVCKKVIGNLKLK